MVRKNKFIGSGWAQREAQIAAIQRRSTIEWEAHALEEYKEKMSKDIQPPPIQLIVAPRLAVELVPMGCWGSNVRKALPRYEWDRLRGRAYAMANCCCNICGVRTKLHCHEVFSYDSATQVQKLEKLEAICEPCHEVKHYGRSSSLGRGDIAFKHLCKVNGWGKQTAMSYIGQQYKTWEELNRIKSWTLDLSLIGKPSFQLSLLMPKYFEVTLEPLE